MILDKEIDVELFMQLNENDTKKILKNFTLGIQLKFWKKYAEWKQNDVELQVDIFYIHLF